MDERYYGYTHDCQEFMAPGSILLTHEPHVGCSLLQFVVSSRVDRVSIVVGALRLVLTELHHELWPEGSVRVEQLSPAPG